MELSALHEAIERGDLLTARTLAIAAWRTAPSVELGDLVDRIEARLPHPPFATKLTPPFPGVRAADDDETRGQILRILRGRERFETVEVLRIALAWQDPRVGRALLDILETVPWIGSKDRKGWRDVFELVAAHGDPRFATFDPAVWKVGAELSRTLTMLWTEAIAAIAPARAPALAALLPVSPDPRAAELLAAVCEHPDDDGPRGVYADWLQQRGDPRGVWIAAQLAGKPAQPSPRDRDALLGPIAPAVAEVTFARGFPHTVVTRFRNELDVARYGHHALWGTVDRITFGSEPTFEDQRMAARTLTPAMRNVRFAYLPWLASILAAPRPWRIEHLAVDNLELEDHPDLLASSHLPALRVLQVEGPLSLGWLAGKRWPGTVVIRHAEYHRRERARLVAEADAAGLERFAVGIVDLAVFERDARGKLVEVRSVSLPHAERWF